MSNRNDKLAAIHGHLYETRHGEGMAVTKNPDGQYRGITDSDSVYEYNADGSYTEDDDDGDFDLVKDITPPDWLEEMSSSGPVEVKIGGKTIVLSLKR